MSTALATIEFQPPQSAGALLNLRQKSFVHKLLECKIQWKAAELAGYQGDEQTLSVTASDLLRNPKVRAYYDECLKQMACSQLEVLAELGEIAKAPWREFVVVKTDPVTGEVVHAQLRLQDKLKALELVGKAHGTFVERVEVDVDREQLGRSVAAVISEAMLAYRAAQQAQLASGPDGPVVQGGGDGLSSPLGTQQAIETTAVVDDVHNRENGP